MVSQRRVLSGWAETSLIRVVCLQALASGWLVAETDARLVRITGQHRCAREIWSTVARLYPQVDSFVKEQDRHRTINLSPCPGSSIVLLDTCNSGGRCEKRHGSWCNTSSAELAIEVASAIAAEAEPGTTIAIISPYRAQVQLLKNSIRAERRAENTPYRSVRVESGTVHQFQGSDADVVIFDLVDGPGRDSLGALLQGDTGLRLVNVAITRAKAKFILIADRQWCFSHGAHFQNSLLDALIGGEEYVGTIPVAPPNLKTPVDNVFESPLERELYDALMQDSRIAPCSAAVCNQGCCRQPNLTR